MARAVKRSNLKAYISIGVALAFAAAWQGTESVNGKFAQLDIKQAPRAVPKEIELNTKSFYPVLIKQVATKGGESANDVEELFKKKQEQKPVEMPVVPQQEPDYGLMLKSRLVMEGSADNGAFINGRFYRVNDKMEGETIVTAKGEMLTPVVRAISRERVSVEAGKYVVSIDLQKD